MKIFKDQKLEVQFNENGYVVIDLLNDSVVERIRKVYDDFFTAPTEEFYINVYGNDFEKRKAISENVQAILKPYADQLFDNFKFVVSALTYKKAGTEKDFLMHQDITITDEEKYPSISIWCPLQDVDHTNGALYIVPYTHKLPSAPRGYNLPSRIDKITAYITEKYTKLIPLRKSQVIIWDHRVLHGSGPNKTNTDRLASVSLLIPENAPVLLYYSEMGQVNNIADVEVLEMADGYYDSYNVKSKPTGADVSLYKKDEVEIFFYTQEEFDAIAQQIQPKQHI